MKEGLQGLGSRYIQLGGRLPADLRCPGEARRISSQSTPLDCVVVVVVVVVLSESRKGGGWDQGVVFKNFISWFSWFPWFPRSIGSCSILTGMVFKISSCGSRGFRASCGFQCRKNRITPFVNNPLPAQQIGAQRPQGVHPKPRMGVGGGGASHERFHTAPF